MGASYPKYNWNTPSAQSWAGRSAWLRVLCVLAPAWVQAAGTLPAAARQTLGILTCDTLEAGKDAPRSTARRLPGVAQVPLAATRPDEQAGGCPLAVLPGRASCLARREAQGRLDYPPFFTASPLAGPSLALAAPLPVELAAFTTQAAGPAVRLQWALAAAPNNRFEIERSLDGLGFTKIGEVPGKGSALPRKPYTFLDAQLPAARLLYYRLRQVEADGAACYSPVWLVLVRKGEELVFALGPAGGATWPGYGTPAHERAGDSEAPVNILAVD